MLGRVSVTAAAMSLTISMHAIAVAYVRGNRIALAAPRC